MIVLNKPSLVTKILSVLGVIFFCIGLGFGSYLVSYKKKAIDKNRFTISQSLAFGNKPVMITFYTLAYLCIIPLVILRGGNMSLKLLRILLLVLSYSLLITIIWITTFRNEKQHYIFAAIIFLSNLLFQIITIISFYNYVNKKKTLVGAGFIQLLVVLLLFTFLLKSMNSKLYSRLFASFENVTVLSMGSVLLALGFV